MASVADLKKAIIKCMKEADSWEDHLEKEIPSKWTLHGDCVLLPIKTFLDPVWVQCPLVFKEICKVLKVTKVARHTGPIHSDDFRHPAIELLHGPDSVVTKKENGVLYKWDITKCMFSSGNISEKQRLAKFDCRDKVVVDLYAGIGYFTLTYLVHAKAKSVFACEWNPEAIHWLKTNLELNKVSEKCKVLEGDNTVTCPKNVADHVNLGLIPSSEASWKVACEALKHETGGILHVHANVDITNKDNKDDNKLSPYESASDYWYRWSDHVKTKMSEHFHTLYPNKTWNVTVIEVVKVKSYGPKVDHLVADVVCKPMILTSETALSCK